MTNKLYNKEPKDIIDQFNNSHNIKDVVEKSTGILIPANNSFPCPIHGGKKKNGASINPIKNVFSCWSEDCGRGLQPWSFVKAFFKTNNFIETAKIINTLFNTNIPVYEKGQAIKGHKVRYDVTETKYDHVFKVDQFAGEKLEEILELIIKNRFILIKGATGIGKTELFTRLADKLGDQKTICLVPTKSLVDKMGEGGKYAKFYEDMVSFEKGAKFIVATFHKAERTLAVLEDEAAYSQLLNELQDTSYTLIIDEVHELLSKRTMLKRSQLIAIESLMANATHAIYTSANTLDFSDSYKGFYNIHIKVEQKVQTATLEKTYVYRLPSGKNSTELKKILTVKKMKESLKKHERVLFHTDNKKLLREFQSMLENEGIKAIVIESNNRSEEAVVEEYNSIVNDAQLKNTVVLCTSTINAGVNIKTENVTIMVYQTRSSFDTNKIIQFLGRLRSNVKNEAIIFLDSGDKNKGRVLKTLIFKDEKMLVEANVNKLNRALESVYGLEDPVEKEVLNNWKFMRDNDEYKYHKDVIFYNRSKKTFSYDEKTLKELVRNRYEQALYYDNNYLLHVLNGEVKTKEFIFRTLEGEIRKEEKEDLENDTTEQDLKENFKEDLADLGDNKEAFEELMLLLTKKIKSDYLRVEDMKELERKYKDLKLYKQFKSNAKRFLEFDKIHGLNSAEKLIKKLMFIYVITDKATDLKEKINNMKRVLVYNTTRYNKESMYAMEEFKKQVIGWGDNIYAAVRLNCEAFMLNRHKITSSKSLEGSLWNTYYKLQGYTEGTIETKKGDYTGTLDKRNKKVNVKKEMVKLKNCIKDIYNISEKGYLTLKTNI